MLPVVTPVEMSVIDASAPATVEVLIERAGHAVARAAVAMLGGTYGRRVVIIVGKGNNGNDGRAAGRVLASRGVRVTLMDAAAVARSLPPVDLVIDAAYGTGFRGTWSPPAVSSPVLAVDIASGLDGLTGRVEHEALRADRTITMIAHKPGTVFGREWCGDVTVADLGVPVERSATFLVEQGDVTRWVPERPRDAHKWRSGVWVVAGSPAMLGAPRLVAAAAQRAGAGMVKLGSPGVDPSIVCPIEAVGKHLSPTWAAEVLADLARYRALVVGPGLGRADATGEMVRRLVAGSPLPTVIDGDGIVALAWSADGAARLLRDRTSPTVLTPHDGEFALLAGARVAPDRIAATRALAHDLHSVVALKGPVTVVCDPAGRTLLVNNGDQRLATAGTGDVLAGIVGALLANGVPAFEAAASAAWLHGRSGALARARGFGLVASDLVGLLPLALAELR